MTTLEQFVERNGPIKCHRAASLIAEIADQLAVLHMAAEVHRDVCPANILLNAAGHAELKSRAICERFPTRVDEHDPAAITNYLAPEQAINSHKADSRADIYSLGCTLYYVLTGRPPFPEGSVCDRLLKHQRERASTVISLRADISPTISALCSQMLEKKPFDRPQSGFEIASRLRSWLDRPEP